MSVTPWTSPAVLSQHVKPHFASAVLEGAVGPPTALIASNLRATKIESTNSPGLLWSTERASIRELYSFIMVMLLAEMQQTLRTNIYIYIMRTDGKVCPGPVLALSST